METFQTVIIACIKTKKKRVTKLLAYFNYLGTYSWLSFRDILGSLILKTYKYISFSYFNPRIKKKYISVTPEFQLTLSLQTYS